MNPQLFGNLGQFNYGSLGDSPALMAPTYAMGGADPTQNPLQQYLAYISGLVNQIGPRGQNPSNPLLPVFPGGGGISEDYPPETYALGGIRG